MNVHKNLSLATWNVHCELDVSKTYLNHLSSKASIIAIQEHGLFNCELPKLRTILKGYDGFGKSSTRLCDDEMGKRRGIGGCGLLWNKDLGFKVKRHLKEGSDRICMIELSLNSGSLFIICVYMPHQTCQIASYEEELNILRNILERYHPKGPCIILGDWNINFGVEFGFRCSGNTTIRANTLMNMLRMYGLLLVDISLKGKGEAYTFKGGHGTSYLDHIVIPVEFYDQVTECVVLPDCIENTSDHLAVVMSTLLNVQDKNPLASGYTKRVAWNKMSEEDILENYTSQLEDRCCKILEESGHDPLFIMNLPEYCGLTCEEIEDMMREMIKAMVEVGDALRGNDFKPNIKPFWNQRLDELSEATLTTQRQWLQNYDRSQRENDAFRAYKDSKREFRRQRRFEEREYDRDEMNKLNQSGEIDIRYFWYLMGRHKLKLITPISNDDGQLLTDPEDIQKEWNKYYEKLYNEGPHEQYDDEFRDEIIVEVQRIEAEILADTSSNYLSGGPITLKDIETVIKSMPNNKASGYDRVSAEHLKHCGMLGKCMITWLVNGMINRHSIPVGLKKGLIVSIPKPEKDCAVKDNNRGLTLLPSLYKVLEKVIILRESSWVNDVISPIQSCGKEHGSCLHSSFAVQQSVTMSLNEGRTVYGGFMDTQKAFDTLWILGLLYKLYKAKINRKAWLLIQNAYTNFYCTALVNGIIGEWFCPRRGVHQGAPLSMILYTIFINGLLKELSHSQFGLCIANINVSSPAHADDVALLTHYKVGLNSMFATSVEYGRKWRYFYNIDKTVFFVWGEDEYPHIEVRFCGKQMERSIKCRHMGVTLTSDSKVKEEVLQERIGKGKQAIFSGLGIGSSNVTTSPNTMSKLYWAIAIPKMIYGVETTPISDACMNMLEDAHRHHANMIQNLPVRTPKPASLALLGWQSIGSYVAYLKIMFMVRTLCLQQTSIYRQLMITGMNTYQRMIERGERHTTPVGDMMKYVERYGLNHVIQRCMNGGNWKLTNSAKVIVKKCILDYEDRAWRASCVLYRGLSLYVEIVTTRRINLWWTVVSHMSGYFKKVSSVVALICGTQPNGYGVNFGLNPRCQICVSYEAETFEHTLFQCDGLDITRQRFMNDLKNNMPQNMWFDFDSMSYAQKFKFLLSGLNSDRYMPEWKDIYLSISTLIFELYKARAMSYNQLNEI